MSFPSAPSFRLLRQSGFLIAMAAFSFQLLGCIFGGTGTGTDTENGVVENKGNTTGVMITGVSARVVDGEGKPIEGVTLRLYQPEYRPDQGGPLANLVRDPGNALVSDSEGYVKLKLTSFGKFVVEGVLAGQTLFYDTLAVPDTTSTTLFTFRTRALKTFTGRAKLVSGMRIDSGTVFIRGTGRFAKLDTAGNYDLGLLPSDVARMAVGIRFSSSPVSVKEATLVSRPEPVSRPDTGGAIITDITQDVYTCKDVSKDSAERISAPANISPASDTATAPVKVDTASVNSALKSCDTLQRGGLVNVVGPESKSAGGDSSGSPVIILQNPVQTASIFGENRLSDPYVVSYGACVLSAGQESTSFDLQLQPTSAGSDILIKDVSEKCLAK
ncbi:MAG: hypothetical protein M3Y08_06075 [Fibrobacterota bacterium]|nr:hypothetical protein [Fibrobacterota bacterium]